MTFKHLTRAAFVNGVGRLPIVSNLADKFSCWARFSRWCVERGGKIGQYRATPHYSHGRRYGLYEKVIAKEGLEGGAIDYLEFGVYRGESMAWWSDHITDSAARFIGFDTFTGLPEAWTAEAPAGTFSVAGQPPRFHDPRCSFEVGLFQNTVPQFLSKFTRRNRLVLHLDADLYSSTLFVLTSVSRLVIPGDLLFFDEFATPTDEFRAFDDFARAFLFRYELIGAVNNLNQVCLKAI
jgi:O-methyltransferase